MKVERTCIVCKSKSEQSDLFRICLKNGKLYLQTDKKLEGRGAYICKNDNCINSLQKSKALNRTFKQNFNDEDYKKLLNSFKH